MAETGQISDGYHTFEELYEHRNLLFLALLAMGPVPGWRARLHRDGTMYEGWFIAGLQSPQGQITYHLPERLWPLLDDKVTTYTTAPAWDGHTPADVCQRLTAWLVEGPHL